MNTLQELEQSIITKYSVIKSWVSDDGLYLNVIFNSGNDLRRAIDDSVPGTRYYFDAFPAATDNPNLHRMIAFIRDAPEEYISFMTAHFKEKYDVEFVV